MMKFFVVFILLCPALIACDDTGSSNHTNNTTNNGTCGDGVCNGDESAGTCPADCDIPSVCTVDGPLPDFASHNSALATFTGSCTGNQLRITLLAGPVVKLTYGDASAWPSYAVQDEQLLDTYGFGVIQTFSLPDFSVEPGLLICAGDLTIEVEGGDCRMIIRDADGTLLLSETPGGGYSESGGDRILVRDALAQEPYFGLGEKTGSSNRRGRSFTMRNTDCYDASYGGYGPEADPLYASIPFYMGIREGTAYGIFTDNTHTMEFDMGHSNAQKTQIFARGGEMVQYFIPGPTPAMVVEKYSDLTGRIPMPPRWSLGYHQSRWGYYPDTRVLEVAQELRTRAIPADGLWLDIQAMEGFRSFTFDASGFPDPEGLMGQLSGMGFHTTMIVDPGIKVDPAWNIYTSGVTGDHFLKNTDGSLFVGEVWPGEAAFPDFSRPATRDWWQTLIPNLTNNGIEGIWIDMNEPASFIAAHGNTVPDSIPADTEGSPTTMARVHNVYALLEAQATYNGLLQALPGRRPFVLTRAGYSGIQRYAAMWTGDAPSSWPTLRNTVPMMTGLGLSGIPLAGSDVGGYSGQATPEMFARWMQVGSFSPFFRGHTEQSGNDQEPWMFGQEVEDISRAVINERYQLLPTMYSLTHNASRTGEPILRPLYYEHPDDTATYHIDDQVYMGPHLMFAPILEEGATSRTVYLPEGRWFDYWSGQVYEGPGDITMDPVTLAALPMFVREGGIIFRSDLTQTAASHPAGPLYIDVYPSTKQSQAIYYEDDGISTDYTGGVYYQVTYTLERSETGATLVASDSSGTWALPRRQTIVTVRRVESMPQSVILDSVTLAMATDPSQLLTAANLWWYNANDLSLMVSLSSGAGFSLSLTYNPDVDPAREVAVGFRVTVPPGTLETDSVYIHTDQNNWEPQLIPWSGTPGVAQGEVLLPRGKWFYYKFTRGTWDTVEKLQDCSEMDNRYGYSQGRYTRQDTITAWADQCP